MKEWADDGGEGEGGEGDEEVLSDGDQRKVMKKWMESGISRASGQ